MGEYNIRFIKFLNKYLEKGDKKMKDYLAERNISFAKYTSECKKLKDLALINHDYELIKLANDVSNKSYSIVCSNRNRQALDERKKQADINREYRSKVFDDVMKKIENGEITESIDYYESPYKDISIIILWSENHMKLDEKHRDMFNAIFKKDRFYRYVDAPISDIDGIINIKFSDGTLHYITDEERKYTVSEMISNGCPLRAYLFKQKFRRLFDQPKKEESVQRSR